MNCPYSGVLVHPLLFLAAYGVELCDLPNWILFSRSGSFRIAPPAQHGPHPHLFVGWRHLSAYSTAEKPHAARNPHRNIVTTQRDKRANEDVQALE